MDEQQLLGLRGLALDEDDPIRRTLAVEMLVAEVRRLQQALDKLETDLGWFAAGMRDPAD